MNQNLRICDYLVNIFDSIPTKSAIKKAIKKGEILVNGEITSTALWVEINQRIEYIPKENESKKIYEIPLDIVFEDDFLAVINKPEGLGVSGNYFKTLENALPYNLLKSNKSDALIYPQPVHRIDRDTAGLVLVAKTGKARRALGKQFEDKTILKTYVAIVIGKPKSMAHINEPIDNKDAYTNVTIISTKDDLSLVELEPVTGRTHQLRKHMQFIGTPILGDPLYGGNSVDIRHKGLYLCAYKIKFHHPIKDEMMEFQIDFPKKFKAFQL